MPPALLPEAQQLLRSQLSFSPNPGPVQASGHVLLIPDLKDMSQLTLSTKTPKNFSAKHQLVLHVAKTEMDKVRVFQVTGEWPWAVPHPCLDWWLLPFQPQSMGCDLFTYLLCLAGNSRAPAMCQGLKSRAQQ